MRFLQKLKRPKLERRKILENQNRILDRLEQIESAISRIDMTGPARDDMRPTPVYVGDATVLTETFFGSKIFVDGRDTSLTPHIIREGQWEPWLTTFLMNELKPGQSFIDIGANCGFYTLLGAKLVGSTGKVVAIEPQKRLSKLIQRSLFANGYAGYVQVVATAIGETVGEAVLEKNEFLTGSASIPGIGPQHDSSEDVQVLPLSYALEQARANGYWETAITADVMKIDAEGYEYLIWQGASDYFRRCKRLVICLEFSPRRYHHMGTPSQVFLDRIRADGFAITVTTSEGGERALTQAELTELAEPGHGHADLILRKGFA